MDSAKKFRILASITDKLRMTKNPDPDMQNNYTMTLLSIDGIMSTPDIMSDIPLEDQNIFWRRMESITTLTDINKIVKLSSIALLELELGTNHPSVVAEKNISLKSIDVDPAYF